MKIKSRKELAVHRTLNLHTWVVPYDVTGPSSFMSFSDLSNNKVWAWKMCVYCGELRNAGDGPFNLDRKLVTKALKEYWRRYESKT